MQVPTPDQAALMIWGGFLLIITAFPKPMRAFVGVALIIITIWASHMA